MVKIFITYTLILLLMAGCAYSVYVNAYPHLKKIRIAPFENRSTEFAIGDDVFGGLNNHFRSDGRLKPVTQNPDCVLEGVISSFEESIHSYDSANRIQDYQLRLSLSVTFTDLVQNEVIWENKNLTLYETYAVSSGSTARFGSKEEASDELIKNLFKTIIQNSLERW
ncbi:MAG: LptE family protein [Candidatus Cloacimonetes bacterium]|nr:penicillin-binding protein activator LpoB [Candidatus Cloacimonadota bacterium]NLO12261.1 LptE family protein [Candidatus Cloacimonadota bacterium]